MKKPSLIIGKKQIILSCLTLMLAVAVYVNYAVTTKSDVVTEDAGTAEQNNVSYGDTEFVIAGTSKAKTTAVSEGTSSSTTTATTTVSAAQSDDSTEAGNFDPGVQAAGQSAEEYFAAARLERTASRDESVATLQSIMGGGDRTDDELITDAIAAVETSQLIESESNIESIVKSMGYTDCIVYLDMDSAKVVVQTEGLDAAQAAAIKDVILGEVTIPAENIRLFEVK